MATYEYECPGDGQTIIINRPIAENEPEGGYDCDVCGATLVRIYRANPVHFKASGFYSTDNR